MVVMMMFSTANLKEKKIEDLIDFRSDIHDPVSLYREVANTYLLYSVLGFQKHVWQNSLLNTVRA